MRPSSILPITWVIVRVLILLNGLIGAAIFGLLIASLVARPLLMKAFALGSDPGAETLMTGMQAIAVLGLAAIPINHAILARLLPIIETVRRRDPFIVDNAYRLNAIAWFLLLLQLISLAVAGIAAFISTHAHPLQLDAGFSPTAWLAVLLTFILARVFAEGTLMREDLEGTI